MGVGGGDRSPKEFLDPPLDLWLCDQIFLFADRQSSTAKESFFASLWLLPKLSYSLVFFTCSSVRWISWAVPFACWEEKPLAKPSLRMKFSATPWLAWWLASWQLFLFKARPLQLPSWSQWWLLAVSFVFYNNNVAWFWKIFTRLYCNLYNVLARPIASSGHVSENNFSIFKINAV